MSSRDYVIMKRILFTTALVCVACAWSDRAWAQQFVRVSVATDGTEANGGSYGAVFSANGRVVGFQSLATNLVPGGTANGQTNVFVRDLVSHTTERVSIATNGLEPPNVASAPPFIPNPGDGISLSADGSIVAFTSRAPLVADDTNSCVGVPATLTIGCADIYVRNRTTGITERVSVASDGTQGNSDSFDPHISADGRYVVFTSSASNLVFGDHNGVRDIFLHDRVAHTTTRLSVSATGNDLTAPSYYPQISGDGQTIVFLSDAAIVSDPDPLPCPPPGSGTNGTDIPCTRAFLSNRATGTISRITIPASVNHAPYTRTGRTVQSLVMTSDGRYVAMGIGPLDTPAGHTFASVAIYDRVTGRTDVRAGAGITSSVTLNDNGRYLGIAGTLTGNVFLINPALRVDRLANVPVVLPAPFSTSSNTIESMDPGRFSPDGLSVLVATNLALIPQDTNGLGDVYLIQRDGDGDGIPDDWETQFGLNPADATDATLDSDGDGVTNLQEYQRGTNPKGTFKRYFAEGAANSFFTTRFALFNPGDQAATVTLEFLGANSQLRSTTLTLPSHGRQAVTLYEGNDFHPDNDFSTIVDADRQVVVDRTMFWDQSGYGSSAETAIELPRTTWYLAEGSTGGAFDLFYLLQNPGDTEANVTVKYLRPAPAPPIVKSYTVAPKTRRTIYVDTEGPELVATDVSAKITSDQAILAERAMYFSTPTQPFAAGHEGAAVAAPAQSWFFAEGATGSFFDLFLLIANAETTEADVQVTYLLASGAPIVKTYPVPANSRLTINVDFEDPRLVDTPVSAIVASTNGVPIIAERAMWWPSPNWYEAHLSAGATTTGTTWALAEGDVTNTAGAETETYILIANTSASAGTADVTLYFTFDPPVTKTIALPANSRVSVQVGTEFPSAIGKGGFGALIQSSGPQIVVERAMYSNANGQVWAAGSDALGTKLQ
jgi:Tol biopolymer transport system component